MMELDDTFEYCANHFRHFADFAFRSFTVLRFLYVLIFEKYSELAALNAICMYNVPIFKQHFLNHLAMFLILEV